MLCMLFNEFISDQKQKNGIQVNGYDQIIYVCLYTTK